MLRKLVLALPVLSLTFLAIATPLQEREAAPGLIEDLLTGILTPLLQLIKDILNGVKSGIDDVLEDKPLICLNSCCKCKCHLLLRHKILTDRIQGGTYRKSSQNNSKQPMANAMIMPALPSVLAFTTLGHGTRIPRMVARMVRS
jgi:hypothetical protein